MVYLNIYELTPLFHFDLKSRFFSKIVALDAEICLPTICRPYAQLGASIVFKLLTPILSPVTLSQHFLGSPVCCKPAAAILYFTPKLLKMLILDDLITLILLTWIRKIILIYQSVIYCLAKPLQRNLQKSNQSRFY